MPARLFLVNLFLVVSVGLAAAQPNTLTAGPVPQMKQDWNAFFRRLAEHTTTGPLTNSLKRGPLLVESDPLGVTGRRKLKVAPLPNSFIEPATKQVFVPPTATD